MNAFRSFSALLLFLFFMQQTTKIAAIFLFSGSEKIGCPFFYWRNKIIYQLLFRTEIKDETQRRYIRKIIRAITQNVFSNQINGCHNPL